MQAFASVATPSYSTPKHSTSASIVTHNLLDALPIPSVPGHSPMHHSSSEPHSAEVSPHSEMVSSPEESPPLFTRKHNSSNEATNTHTKYKEPYHSSRSATISRESSDYSLSSSVSELSKASLEIATKMIHNAMYAVARGVNSYSQEQLQYHSNSNASIPQPPHFDSISIHSDIAGAPLGQKQSRSFHGTHSTGRVKMRRTPSAPSHNRHYIHKPMASSAPHSGGLHTQVEDKRQVKPILHEFTDSYDHEEHQAMMPPAIPENRELLYHCGSSEATPRVSMSVESWRVSTVSDATTIKRNSAASEAPSESTLVSPRTSVYGKGE